jgi:predicted metal-dependent hydrolase
MMGILSISKFTGKSHLVSHTADSLIPRKVKFDWMDTPLEWIPGQPFASHFIN